MAVKCLTVNIIYQSTLKAEDGPSMVYTWGQQNDPGYIDPTITELLTKEDFTQYSTVNVCMGNIKIDARNPLLDERI